MWCTQWQESIAALKSKYESKADPSDPGVNIGDNPEDFLRICSSDILHHEVAIESTNATNTTVVIPERCHQFLAERLVSEVTLRAEVRRTAEHPTLRNASFFQLFVRSIQKINCAKVFFTTEDSIDRSTFVTCYISNNFDHHDAEQQISLLLDCIGKCEHAASQSFSVTDRQRCWKCDVRYEVLTLCCQREKKGVTLLDQAERTKEVVNEDSWRLVKLLLHNGALPDSRVLDMVIWGRFADNIKTCNFDIVKKVIVYGAVPILCSGQNGSWGSKLSLVRELLKSGAVPDELSMKCTALLGNPDMFRLFVESGTRSELLKLNLAALEGDNGLLRSTMECGTLPNNITIYSAVFGGSVDTVRAVLERCTETDESVLHCAIMTNNQDIVETLLESEVVPTATTVELALSRGNEAIATAVLNKTNKNSLTEGTANSAALLFNLRDMPTFLLENGVVPDASTLNRIILEGNVVLLTHLMDQGAMLNVESINCAIKSGNWDMVRTVFKYGAVPDENTFRIALMTDDLDILWTVIETGALTEHVLSRWANSEGSRAIANTLINNLADCPPQLIKDLLKHQDIYRHLVEHANHKTLEGRVDVVREVWRLGISPESGVINRMILAGNWDIVQEAINQGFVPDTATLKCVIKSGNAEMVRTVMKYGAAPNEHILQTAILTDDTEMIWTVLESLELPEHVLLRWTKTGGTCVFVRALIEHIADHKCHLIKDMLTNDIQAGRHIYLRFVEHANQNALAGRIDVFKELGELGILPDMEVISRMVLAGNNGIVKEMLNHWFLLKINVLNCAFKRQDIELIQTLMSHGFMPDESTLRIASLTGNQELVSAVIEREMLAEHRLVHMANLDHSNTIGRVLIKHLAEDNIQLSKNMLSNEDNIRRLLVEHTNHKTLAGQTDDVLEKFGKLGVLPDAEVVNRMILIGNIRVVKEVIEQGFVPDTHSLNYAVRSGILDMVNTVLAFGVQPDVLTRQYAECCGNMDIVKAINAVELLH